MSKKNKTKRLIERKKNIILYNNPQFLLFSFVFLKLFLASKHYPQQLNNLKLNKLFNPQKKKKKSHHRTDGEVKVK